MKLVDILVIVIVWSGALVHAYLFWCNKKWYKRLKDVRNQALHLFDSYTQPSVRMAMDKYFGEPGTKKRAEFEEMKSTVPKRSNLCWILYAIHPHAEIVNDENPDQAVYTEADVNGLLNTLGYEINWGE